MAALTASATMHSSTASGSSRYQAYDQLIIASSAPLHLEQHRERFQERALRDVTMHSNESAMTMDPGNPLLVKEEMEAQKDYFRRLKFTYLEQEAKREFLDSITGDEPKGVRPGENEEREQINARKKAALKTTKAEVDEMRETALRLAQENATKHIELQKQLLEAQAVYKQIAEMELELKRIKATHPPENRLTVSQANDVLDAQTVEIEGLTEELSSTAENTEVTMEEVVRTRRGVSTLLPGSSTGYGPLVPIADERLRQVAKLEREREREEARAKEVREGREAGDTKVDEMCNWLSASLSFYRNLLGIRSVKAVFENELHLEYDVPAPMLSKSKAGEKRAVTLVLHFDPATKRLTTAHLMGSDLDIEEATCVAAASNDVSGLIADVLMRLR